MNATSTPNAMPTSRTATRVRRCGATSRMIGMKTGRLPSGSSTSSSRMKAERKLWSMRRDCGAALRRVADDERNIAPVGRRSRIP